MKTRSRPSLVQGDLFEPPVTRPVWRNLPPEMQDRLKKLLIQLLREHPRDQAAVRRGKEAGHE